MGIGVKIAIFLAVIFLISKIWKAVSRKRKEKRNKIEALKQDFKSQFANFEFRLYGMKDNVNNCFKKNYYITNQTAYNNVLNNINRYFSDMTNYLAKMKEINNALVSISRRDDQSSLIAHHETTMLVEAQELIDGLKKFSANLKKIPASRMLDPKNYGRINKEYWNAVCAMTRDEAVGYVEQCENLLDGEDFKAIFSIDMEKLIRCAWFFATEKTVHMPSFQKAENVFSRIYKSSYSDLILANLYAKKQIGGEDALREPIRVFCNSDYSTNICSNIASGLMWLQAYNCEQTVLRHMLQREMVMSKKEQERLHALTSGGNVPAGFDVKSTGEALYFDVSALAWDDKEFIGLFDNLAFQDKNLSYSLAIREENKDLFIAQGIKMPGSEQLLSKLNAVFEEEYGSDVRAISVSCTALSGSGEEKMEGILVNSAECAHMGILIHVAKIGKKLIIKFYTLFMPIGTDLNTQKQQALSMHKKLSPSVTMWEGSLKDTMLMAVEQLLNAGTEPPASEPKVTETKAESVPAAEEIVF